MKAGGSTSQVPAPRRADGEGEQCPRFRRTLIRGDKARRLFEYWDAKRGERPMPRREDIDPVDLRDLLPNIFMIDVLDDGEAPTFRYRLVGTALDDQAQRNLTGQTVSPPDPENSLGSHYISYLETFRRCEPFYHFAQTKDAIDRQPAEFERLVLPLSNDGDRVDILIGVADYRNLSMRREL